jgi:hypothetical protein
MPLGCNSLGAFLHLRNKGMEMIDVNNNSPRYILSHAIRELQQDVFSPVQMILVDSISDLPAPMGNVITLLPERQYTLRNPITTNLTLRFSNGSSLVGGGTFGYAYTYTGTGDAFVATNSSMSVFDLQISAPSCSNLFNVTGNTTHTLYSKNCRFNGVNKLGTLFGVAPVFFDFTALNITQGFTFGGSFIIGFAFRNAYMQDNNSSCVMFDFTNAGFKDLEITKIIMQGTGTCFKSSVGGAANILSGIEATVEGCTFGLLGTMTPLSGFTNGFDTDRWKFQGNSPRPQVTDTGIDADYVLSGSQQTIDVVTQGVYYTMPTLVGATYVPDLLQGFTLDTNTGALTYTRQESVKAIISIKASVTKVGGGSHVVNMRIARNWSGSGIGEMKSTGLTQSPDPTQVISDGIFTLNQGDTIRPIFSNVSGTSDILVSGLSVRVNAI